MDQVWRVVRRRCRSRTLISSTVVVVLLPVLFCAVSIGFWRALIIENKLTVSSQGDYEDAALCIKFGFPRGTEKHDSCKLDLLNLRHSDEDLMARTSLP